MKTISLFFTIIITLVSSFSAAQTQPKDSITIGTYIGFQGTVDSYPDHTEKDISFRAGGFANWFITNNFIASSWGFLDFNGESTVENMMFGVNYKPNRNLKFSIGHIPTVSATIRPIPISVDGHFESWTTDKLPGLAPGVSAIYSDSSVTAGVGLSYRYEHSEIHGRISTLNTSIVGYYNSDKKHWGIGAEYLHGPICLQGVVNETLYSSLVSIRMHKDLGIGAYAVGGIDRETSGWMKKEIGLTKGLSKGPFQGILGMGYELKKKALRMYILVAI